MSSESPSFLSLGLAARQVRSVLVEVAIGDATGALADIAGGRTVLASGPETAASLRSLLEAVAREGVERGDLTAGTVAAAAEALRVRPEEGARWEPEPGIAGPRFRLPRPCPDLPASMGEALRRRRSASGFPPLPAASLSSLLYHAARVRDAWAAPDGYPASSRASPSAGGRHPVDLVVVAGDVPGLEPPPGAAARAYFFDPMTCELVALRGADEQRFAAGIDFAQGLVGHRPAALLALAARAGRTLSRYRGGLSLVYRDAGALMATAGLVAAALGLACRPVALSVPEGTEPWETADWLDVGGVALGGALPADG